ncbi:MULTISPECIES: hypothetical protein [unclassified Streptomyces]|uniref:hypothetical protein n=1 Tax=unclassified Streptomyces TaxID=2593676 RepID=UPI001BE5CE28|nr:MULTISPECIES: hypothetical protein [unclassified Streptomyces]MBT2405298.1 hypothetical protein [Streptomyces sp. ISL-21]MBT2613294.1 hypothetical protein [Streptomyces sp. ISL-87]
MKRASGLFAAVIVAGLGLTACQQADSGATGGEKAPSAASSSAADTGKASGAPAATPSAVVGGTTLPADLPAGLPLPQGELTSVTGTAGSYVLVYRSSGTAGQVAQYATALESAGYTVTRGGGTVAASEKGVDVVVTSTPTTLTVALSQE